MPEPTTVLIDFGDLPSLVAAVTHHQPGRLMLWHPFQPGQAGKRRRVMVRNHGALLDGCRVILADESPVGLQDLPTTQGLDESHLLLNAVTVARQLAINTVVWPVHFGLDIQQIGPAVERALAVAAVVAVSHDGPPMTIDLPLMELTDEQLVDLLDDNAAPRRGFWPCEKGDDEPCGTCDGCKRWTAAFKAFGQPWPWEKTGMLGISPVSSSH